MELAPPWTLRMLTTEYFDEALEVLLDTFIKSDPLGLALGVTRADLSHLYPREQMLSLLQHELSMVAVTSEATNKVVGACFMDGKFPSDVGSGSPKWMAGPWNALVDRLVDMSEFQGFTPNQFVRGLGIAVAEEWAGNGIARALTIDIARLAKKRGYKFALSIFTNKYTTKIALDLGFELKAFQKYHEFEYNGVKPYIGVDPKHEGVGFGVLDLEKFHE